MDKTDQPKDNPLTADKTDQPKDSPLTADKTDQPKDNPLTADKTDQPKDNPLTADKTDQPKDNPLTADKTDQPKDSPLTADKTDQPKDCPLIADKTDKTDQPKDCPLNAETGASVIVAVGFIFILYQAVLVELPQLLLGIVGVTVTLSLWVEQLPLQPALLKVHWQWILRENCGKGVWCCLLVPTAVIVSSFKNSAVDDREAMLLMFCVSMMVMGLLTCETAANKPMMDECEATEGDPEDECICIPAVTVLERKYLVVLIGILVFYGLIIFRLTMLQYSIVCLFTLLVAGLIIIAPRWFPHSFTMGENIICTQAFSLFLLSISLGNTPAKSAWKAQEKTAAEVLVFMQIAVLSCIFVVCTVAILPKCRAFKQFHFLLISVAMAISLPLLYWYLQQNFIMWLFHYILESEIKERLFVFWSASCVVAMAIVYVNSQKIKCSVAAQKRRPDIDMTQTDKYETAKKTEDRSGKHRTANRCSAKHETADKTDDSSDRHEKTPKTTGERSDEHESAQETENVMAEERRNASLLARKQFHILMLCVFLPGLVFHKEMLTLAATCALGVFILAECVHVWRIPPFGAVLHEWLQVFVDDRDQGVVLLTPLYLLVGFSLPLWLHSIGSGVTLSLYSGVLSTGLGDMVAAVVGSKWGSHRWPGTRKTVEGTAASVVSQLLAVYIIFHLGVCPQIGWFQVTVAVVLTSLLEAFTSQIDNLVLPLFMYNLLAL